MQRYNAEVRIIDAPPDLRVGMSANIHIAYKELSDVVAVPVSAIEYRDGSAWVKRQQGERVVATEVTLGDVGLELVEVTAGLQAGERIAVGAQ